MVISGRYRRLLWKHSCHPSSKALPRLLPLNPKALQYYSLVSLVKKAHHSISGIMTSYHSRYGGFESFFFVRKSRPDLLTRGEACFFQQVFNPCFPDKGVCTDLFKYKIKASVSCRNLCKWQLFYLLCVHSYWPKTFQEDIVLTCAQPPCSLTGHDNTWQQWMGLF